MKSLVLSLGLVALLCLGSTAQATSPCCDAASGAVAELNGKNCDDFAPPAAAGCAEYDDDNCIGGGPVPSEDPQAQSPLGGCICVGGTCVSDGSVGAGLNGAEDLTAADRECTRDAVAGCCANGACSDAE